MASRVISILATVATCRHGRPRARAEQRRQHGHGQRPGDGLRRQHDEHPARAVGHATRLHDDVAGRPGARQAGATGQSRVRHGHDQRAHGRRPSMGSTSKSGTSMDGGAGGSEQVKAVQKALQDKGMDPGPIDGIMGPKTMAALKAFQKDQKLTESGRLDDQTREKLGVSR